MAAKHTQAQLGTVAGADFEANTLTVELPPGFIVAAGPVAVLPRDTYQALLGACGQASFCLRELLPNDGDAQLTVMLLKDAIAKATGSAA